MTHRKHRPGAPPGFFAAEAAGLRWLAEARGARVVEVLGHGEDWIELEELTPASPTTAHAEAFGRALAQTHAAGALAFGWKPQPGPSWIGRQEQPCTPSADWVDFYVTQRVLPFVGKAVDVGHLRAAGAREVEAACARIQPTDVAPARIHGDLWSGNVLWTSAGGVLIDPAAHGGHPETDLAMLALFGVAHLERITASYDEAAPLAEGWRDRVPLHQLHPLAVHAASHGPAYAEELIRAARRTG